MYRNHMTLQLNSASSGRWMSNTYRLTATQAHYLTSSTSIPSLMRPVENISYSLSKSSRPTQLFNVSKWLLNTLAINQKSFKQIMESSFPISKRPNKCTHLTYFVRNLALSINWFDHGLPDIMIKWTQPSKWQSTFLPAFDILFLWWSYQADETLSLSFQSTSYADFRLEISYRYQKSFTRSYLLVKLNK